MPDNDPAGATPIDPDEAGDLIPGHIQTRDELNAWEQQNILAAAQWARRTTLAATSDHMIRELHRRMFDRTWTWAGHFRQTDKNLGVRWETIPVEVRKLADDAAYWIEHATRSLDEAALRLHHRQVSIHPFPNGNGRHARLWCDTLLAQNGRPPIAWKAPELDRPGEARRAYIDALRSADGGDYAPLLELYLKGRE